METTQPESLLAIKRDESHIRATDLFNNISKGFKNDFANGNIGNLCFAASIPPSEKREQFLSNLTKI